jgi:hypothetical protein
VAILQGTIAGNDPDIVGKLIADAINALENLYIVLNLPQDGFIPNTPPRD